MTGSNTEEVRTAGELPPDAIRVLSDGFVKLVDVMGNTSAIVQAARVSYGAGTKHLQEDNDLIRYLMRHRHTTPFEMVELKFLVRAPMDAWRQWVRHRTASINEYSTRYSEAIDSMDTTAADAWRLQSELNKQGSNGTVTEWPDHITDKIELPEGLDLLDFNGPGDYLTQQEEKLHEVVRAVYKERLALGVAREQARKDLPLSTYTEAYWKIDLHNLLHFLGLRMEAHAQKEIRAYATVIGEQIIAKLFPVVWEAFLDYRFNAVTLSATEVALVQRLLQNGNFAAEDCDREAAVTSTFTSKSERRECLAKLKRLMDTSV